MLDCQAQYQEDITVEYIDIGGGPALVAESHQIEDFKMLSLTLTPERAKWFDELKKKVADDSKGTWKNGVAAEEAAMEAAEAVLESAAAVLGWVTPPAVLPAADVATSATVLATALRPSITTATTSTRTSSRASPSTTT
eukprot:1529786-Rhodomonas_salina.1